MNLKPKECMMIGNDYLKDIVPAKAVGLHTILFTDDENTKIEKCSDADYTIHSMNQLHEIILHLE
ncbi:HAD family hydrolase [Gracilibacillus caseinilyticus]|uniref:HAD family hydrolase n=1 Tax=Gracilibacillus caseinilyticus TaxID=2932256 RepID=UPI00350F41DE